MKIIFSFKDEPTNNFLCTDGTAEAVTLFDNGIVWYERFKFCHEEPEIRKEFGPYPDAVPAMQQLIADYAEEVKDFPDFIDTESYDGSWQIFTLGDKKITVDNMATRYVEVDVPWLRYCYIGEEFQKKLERQMTYTYQMNKMLEIYCKATAIMKKYCSAEESPEASREPKYRPASAGFHYRGDTIGLP